MIFTILVSKIYNDSNDDLELIHKEKNRDEIIKDFIFKLERFNKN